MLAQALKWGLPLPIKIYGYLILLPLRNTVDNPFDEEAS